MSASAVLFRHLNISISTPYRHVACWFVSKYMSVHPFSSDSSIKSLFFNVQTPYERIHSYVTSIAQSIRKHAFHVMLLNSLLRSDAIWRHGNWSILDQVMACCRAAPSHYLNQCWFITERSGPWFNIRTSSYQYRESHCGDKTILRPSYLHNGIFYTGKITSL